MMRWQKPLVAIALAFLWFGLTSRAGAADFPKGTFTLKDPGGTVWSVNFDGKDKLTVTRDGKEVVEGGYKVNKEEIEFTDEKGPFAGEGDTKTGAYKWKLEGAQLTFTRVKDKSEGRARILTAGAWERKGNE